MIGSKADPKTLRTAREAILENPRGWIAQREVALSTVPTLIGDKMRPRHVDLRPFAVNDRNNVWVLPGGLTRVALPEGELVVNSSQGGGSKDTWVLEPPRTRSRCPRSCRESAPSSAVRPDPDARLRRPAPTGSQQGQQQQPRRRAAQRAGRRNGPGRGRRSDRGDVAC